MIHPDDLTPEACARNDRGALRILAFILFGVPLALGCAFTRDLQRSVTPEDRAAAYRAQARTSALACKAYAFDRSVGLVGDVPEMAQVCGE